MVTSTVNVGHKKCVYFRYVINKVLFILLFTFGFQCIFLKEKNASKECLKIQNKEVSNKK